MTSLNAARAEAGSREFPFDAKDFDRVRRLIYDHAGIMLAPGKQDMVYSRLSRRLRARGLTHFKDYLAVLESNDAAEWEAFTNSLTTNLTSFFREEHHFPLLAEHALRAWRARRKPLSIWCCAASTGEEPYSLAITLADAFDSTKPPVSILATDVDTDVLAKAQRGVYPMERVEKLPPSVLKRHFMQGKGTHQGMVKVRPALQNMITFKPLNLLAAAWPVSGPYDAIFCRNVMIYFDKATQRAIVNRFVPVLQPDGLMFAGHSESFFHCADLIRLRGKTVYELAHKRQGGSK